MQYSLWWARLVSVFQIAIIHTHADVSEGAFSGISADAETVRQWFEAVYAPRLDWESIFEIDGERSEIRLRGISGAIIETIPLGVGDSAARPWRSRPLVILDPGHIGGAWGILERRSFRIGNGPVFQEGDVVLAVAQRVRELAWELDLEILLTRESSEPVTSLRPDDFLLEALVAVVGAGRSMEDLNFAEVVAVRSMAERLFYVTAEIRARAAWVNGRRPDLVVALHINADPWPAGETLQLRATPQHLHILLHGAYMPGELSTDEDRRSLLGKLQHGPVDKELAAGGVFLAALRRATGLPPFRYTGPQAVAMDGEGYLWGRNLAANRLFQAPVVFLEPYVANTIEGYSHFSMGDYEGLAMVLGRERLSLVEEYARAVVEGLQLWLLDRNRAE